MPIHKPELGACWVWTGARNSRGYGCFGDNGTIKLVHRIVYEMEIGNLTPGLQIDHLCFLKVCCRPSHLEQISGSENKKRSREFRNKPPVTHCPNGHAYVESNTYINNRGGRSCKTCKLEKQREKREILLGRPLNTPNKDKTHCKRGHEYNIENTALYTDGRRHCRQCRRISDKNRRGM